MRHGAMTLALPEGRAGSALAVLLLGGALLMLWLVGAAPLLARHAAAEDALRQRRALQHRLEAVAASLPLLQERAALVPDSGEAAPALLEGGTDAVAGASLQQAVRRMAGEAGATLFSVETLPAQPSGAYRRIGLRLSLAAPWPVLMQLLQAIGQARPRMAVDDLDLRQTQLRTGTEEALLNASLTLYAFRGGDEPAPRPGTQP
ncbi:type II secretion system protein GspM [Roseicella sp. DB1501]|uniref:type II secretion system protein GspM n=1 Tax=Roseicella sp. DB1501 TaxID=2730925 RepID=UPI0014910E46|nr:type II secretion system protein GspM [Roseicella sp. DB1501]